MHEYSAFELFLKNNAVWMMALALMVSVDSVIKNIYYNWKYKKKADQFFNCAMVVGVITLFCGGIALGAFLAEGMMVVFGIFYGAWVVTLIVCISVYSATKSRCKGDSPTVEVDVTQRELEKRIEKAKKNMRMR